MSWRHFRSLLSDLFQVLPGRALPEWERLEQVDGSKPTIILVSGFAATNRNLSVMRRRLKKDGYSVVILALDWQALSDGVQGLYRMAEKLSSVVLKLRKGPCRGNTQIYLVAHSAGGLVARYYVQQLGGFHYCDGLVTLATPHQGTWLAVMGLFCHLILKARCLLQMLPISPFIKKINHTRLPVGFRMISICSKDDLLCPLKATRINMLAADPGSVESIEIPGVSHGGFLTSKRSYRLLTQVLRGIQGSSSLQTQTSQSPEIAIP